MEKSRQELVDNYKAEQRAIKTRKVLTKTKEWGEIIAALLFASVLGLTVIMICVSIWKLGFGFILIIAAVVLAVVGVWNLIDHWAYNEIEKARYQRSKTNKEGK